MCVDSPTSPQNANHSGAQNGIAVCVDSASLAHNLSRVLVGNDLSVVPQNHNKIHGRAWIFSENGHPFVRIRGHFPCQGNNPPLRFVGNDRRRVPQITVILSGDSCIDTISQIGSKKLVILSVAKDLDPLNEMAETRFFGFASE